MRWLSTTSASPRASAISIVGERSRNGASRRASGSDAAAGCVNTSEPPRTDHVGDTTSPK
jgi:hypothetical protein